MAEQTGADKTQPPSPPPPSPSPAAPPKQPPQPEMNSDEFNKYVKDRYNGEMTWFHRHACRHMWAYRITQTYTIAASGSIPVLLKVGNMNLLVVAALAASVAAVQAFQTAMRFRDNWLNYRTTREAMASEIYLYEAKVDDYGKAADPKGLFVKRVESLISKENTLWRAAVSQEETKPNGPQPAGVPAQPEAKVVS